MKCILLCAGYGTRLYPLTKDTPKPLLKVAGRPMIEHVLLRIEEIREIDEIFIVTNDKFYSSFVEWSGNYASEKRIEIINDKTTSDDNRLGAIGDIHFVINSKNIDDDVLIIAGDNLFEFPLRHLIDFFEEKQASVVALYDIKDKSIAANKYGVVETDSDQKIVGFEEKPANPKTTLVSTACYVFSRDDIAELEKCIKEHNQPDNLGDFVKWLSARKPFYGFAFSERWFDIGDHEQLKKADEEWK